MVIGFNFSFFSKYSSLPSEHIICYGLALLQSYGNVIYIISVIVVLQVKLFFNFKVEILENVGKIKNTQSY